MTERLRASPYGAYCQSESRAVPQVSYESLGTKKTLLVMVIVVGCFAVLWPKLFYPMLVSNANNHIKPGPIDKTTGCCDVISELDVDTIKIMSELCGTIIEHQGKSPPDPKDIVAQCRKAVLETCGIDISAALQDRISLGHSVKQILEEVRSLNGSLCLKYNFGVSPWRLGVPHRVNINLDPTNSIKQERPPHLKPGLVHPAFRERGRAIPEADRSTRRSVPPPRIVEGRPGPIPGMRPAMGGLGHVVPPSKQSNYGFMGILMPIYTVGFVVFFSYTIMKLVFKKKPEVYVGAPLYPPCDTDEQFHKEVFEANKHYFNRPNKDTSKIGWKERDARDEELDQLRNRLRETELAMERIVHQMARAPLATHQDEIKANGSLPKEEEAEEQGHVTVMGMETTASCEGGKKWSRPDSPVLPHPQPKEPSPPPQQIFLEGALPPQSQILVADSAIEAQKDLEDDSSVVLAGKMTLSVISLDSEPGTEESSKKSNDERRRSSSNTSDEFEKINAADLEDQINNIIEEAEHLALAEENRISLEEHLEGLSNREIPRAPEINEKQSNSVILEEIKNQFNLEDDLLQALKEREPEEKVTLPVTDIIKEFLNNEESVLLGENLVVDRENIAEISREAQGLEDEEYEILHNQETNKSDKEIFESPVEEQMNLSVKQEPVLAEAPAATTENLQSKPEEDGVSMGDLLYQELALKENDGTEDQGETTLEPEEQQPIEEALQHVSIQEPLSGASEDGQATTKIKAEELSAIENQVEEIKVNEFLPFSASPANEQTKEDDSLEPTSIPEVEQGNKEVTVKAAVAEDEQHKDEVNVEKSLSAVKDQVEEGDLIQHSEDEQTNEEVSVEEKPAVKDHVEADDPEEGQRQDEQISVTHEEDLIKEESENQQHPPDVLDVEELVVEDIEYEDESDEEEPDEDELRQVDEDRDSVERRVNGEDSSRNGAGNSETAAENEISEDELANDEEEIEEIIEYVDNTDDEGEEIIEINGNEHAPPNVNGAN